MTKICHKDESSASPLVETSANQTSPPAKSLTINKVKKTTSAHKMDGHVSADEMQSLLAKLKELVPNMPRNKKLTKLEIIQNVIDYIFDLQLALESHPQSICQPSNNSSPNSTLGPRLPLSIKYSS